MFFILPRLWRLIQSRLNIGKQEAGPAVATLTAADQIAGGSSGLVGMLLHQAKFDLLVNRRNPRARFFTYIFPILLLVIFSSAFGGSHTTAEGAKITLTLFYVPGIMAMSVMTAAYAGMVVQVSNLRQTGVFKRRRATPLPAWMLIASAALVASFNTLVMSTILLLIARFGYSVSFAAGPIAAMGISVLAGALTFTCISFAIAALIRNADAAQPIVQITMLPLYFISGVFIPTNNFGSGLNTVAKVFPLQHIADGLHRAASPLTHTFGAAVYLPNLLILAAWALAAIAFSAWKFSWLPSRV